MLIWCINYRRPNKTAWWKIKRIIQIALLVCLKTYVRISLAKSAGKTSNPCSNRRKQFEFEAMLEKNSSLILFFQFYFKKKSFGISPQAMKYHQIKKGDDGERLKLVIVFLGGKDRKTAIPFWWKRASPQGERCWRLKCAHTCPQLVAVTIYLLFVMPWF